MARRQAVHVGETVEYDFVLTDGWGRFRLPSGIDEYAVLYVGNERIETEPDLSGHFRFALRTKSARPGDSFEASAAAYQQRGNRDFIKIGSEWLQSTSPFEEPDRLVASDSVLLETYQTKVELTVPRPAHDLDLSSGVLRLHRVDGRTTTRYVDRPGRPGFTVTGPEPEGAFTVRYQPDGDELNPTGTTRVEFSISDLGGQRHEVSVWLDTP